MAGAINNLPDSYLDGLPPAMAAWLRTVPQANLDALFKYTQASREINGALRTGEGTDEYREQIRLMRELFTTYAYHGPMPETVYRGTNTAHDGPDLGFTSTSTSAEVARRFGREVGEYSTAGLTQGLIPVPPSMLNEDEVEWLGDTSTQLRDGHVVSDEPPLPTNDEPSLPISRANADAAIAWFNGLSPDEQESLVHYIDDSTDINLYLRTGDYREGTSPRYQRAVRRDALRISYLSPLELPEPITLYRGTDQNVAGALKDEAISSWSLLHETAERFPSQPTAPRRTLTTTIPAGQPVLPMWVVQAALDDDVVGYDDLFEVVDPEGEWEVAFPPNTKVTLDANGTPKVEVKPKGMEGQDANLELVTDKLDEGVGKAMDEGIKKLHSVVFPSGGATSTRMSQLMADPALSPEGRQALNDLQERLFNAWDNAPDMTGLGFPAPVPLPLHPSFEKALTTLQRAMTQASIALGQGATDLARSLWRAGAATSTYQARRIARTETVRAYWQETWSQTKASRDAGLIVLVWSCEDGPRTCQHCRDMDGLVCKDESITDHVMGRCTLVPELASDHKTTPPVVDKPTFDQSMAAHTPEISKKALKAWKEGAHAGHDTPLGAVMPVVRADYAQRIQSQLDKTFGAGKYHTRIDSVLSPSDPVLSFSIIDNTSGLQCGKIRRQLNNGSIQHAFLSLDPPLQGQGFATRLNAEMFEVYRLAGLSKVTVHANIDVGGYTWARQGFDISPETKAEILDVGHSAELAITPSKVKKVDKLLGDYVKGHPDFTMADVAAQPWGKDALLGSSWFGEYIL